MYLVELTTIMLFITWDARNVGVGRTSSKY